MKVIMIIWILIWNQARADYIDQVPQSFCSREFSSCSEFSIQVAENYVKGELPKIISEDSLYTGICRMMGPSYDENHEQHGYVYFRKNRSQIDFFGEFSFFSPEDPYQNLTLEEVRIKHSETSQYQVIEKSKHWQINIFPNPTWQYFVRLFQSNIQLIGFWGPDSAVTCELFLIN